MPSGMSPTTCALVITKWRLRSMIDPLPSPSGILYLIETAPAETKSCSILGPSDITIQTADRSTRPYRLCSASASARVAGVAANRKLAAASSPSAGQPPLNLSRTNRFLIGKNPTTRDPISCIGIQNRLPVQRSRDPPANNVTLGFNTNWCDVKDTQQLIQV